MGILMLTKMARAMRDKQNAAQAAPPAQAQLPPWFQNPSIMGGGQMPPMPTGTPPVNPMGGPGGQAPMQGMPFQWRGVMPRGYGG